MNIADPTKMKAAEVHVRSIANNAQIAAPKLKIPAPVERAAGGKGAAAAAVSKLPAKKREDVCVTSALADRNAFYNVADIRRGGGHILPRYQVVRQITLEGDRLVEKMVDIILVSERKSLQIFRKDKTTR